MILHTLMRHKTRSTEKCKETRIAFCEAFKNKKNKAAKRRLVPILGVVSFCTPTLKITGSPCLFVTAKPRDVSVA